MGVVAELNLQLLHLVVMEILLDQVALSLYSSPHVVGNVGNHPGHKELYQEHNMLWRKKAQQVSFSYTLRDTERKMCVCVGELVLLLI